MMMFVNLINQNVARHDNIASNYPSPSSLPIITIPWLQLRSLLPWSRTPPTLVQHCLILLLDSLLISCPASETPQPFHHGKYYCQIFSEQILLSWINPIMESLQEIYCHLHSRSLLVKLVFNFLESFLASSKSNFVSHYCCWPDKSLLIVCWTKFAHVLHFSCL